MSSDEEVIHREAKLRDWFTQGLPENDRIIDGFDIGWGGTASWATSLLAEYLDPQESITILDVACGYGTFLVELGWRFPYAQLVGLNLDFEPPHNLIISLLSQGNVKAHLISADALQLPLISAKFDCVSCFLGLQDIAITRGKDSLVKVVSELLQAVSLQKYLILLDNFSKESFENILSKQNFEYDLIFHGSFEPNCQWSREVGIRAVEMYAQGYLQQQLDSNNPPNDSHKALVKIRKKMLKELENQLTNKGYYNPWGVMRLVLLRRL